MYVLGTYPGDTSLRLANFDNACQTAGARYEREKWLATLTLQAVRLCRMRFRDIVNHHDSPVGRTRALFSGAKPPDCFFLSRVAPGGTESMLQLFFSLAGLVNGIWLGPAA